MDRLRVFINLDPPYIRFTKEEDKNYVHRELTLEGLGQLLVVLGVIENSSKLPRREFIAAGDFFVDEEALRSLGLLCETDECDCVGLECAWTGCAKDILTGGCACNVSTVAETVDEEQCCEQ
jgi:hypothetical protein